MDTVRPLKGFAFLLIFQCFGELVSQLLHLPFPGPVLGMLFLVPCLASRPIREAVISCTNFLLSHLSLLFIPISVGLMNEAELLKTYGVAMVGVLLVSCALGLFVTAKLLSWWLPKDESEVPIIEDTLDKEDPQVQQEKGAS